MTTLDDYLAAALRKAEAELDLHRVRAQLRAEQRWRETGRTEREIEVLAAEYAAQLAEWRNGSLQDICGTLNEAHLGREGSTVGPEHQSGTRH